MYVLNMRTTVDIDMDIMMACKSMAKEKGMSLGKALSDMARKGFGMAGSAKRNALGIPMLPSRSGVVVTNEIIDQLRDEMGI